MRLDERTRLCFFLVAVMFTLFYINKDDLNLIHITDDVHEAVKIINTYYDSTDLNDGVIKEKIVTNSDYPDEKYRRTEYIPNLGFNGEDKAVLKVTYKGKSVNVLYILRTAEVRSR